MAAEYDHVIGSLYQAAITRECWPEALGRFASLNGSRGTNLVRDAGGRLDVIHSPGLGATVAQFVEQGWDRDDYRTQRALPLLGNGFVADQHIIAPDDVARSRYYADFAHPAGVPWFAATGVMLPNGALAGISLQRSESEGAFSTGELHRLNRMLPRLREILLLAYRVGLERNDAALAGLDLVGQAAILFDQSGLICGMNQAAEALAGTAFVTHGRRMVAIRPHQRRALTERIDQASGRENFTGAPGAIRLEDSRDRTWLGQFAPVEGHARDFFRNGVTMLILSAVHVDKGSTSAALRAAFGLTPREASVAELLAAGMETNGIAAQLSLSRNAVRFHIKSILPKASVRRQAEFVAVAARLLLH